MQSGKHGIDFVKNLVSLSDTTGKAMVISTFGASV